MSKHTPGPLTVRQSEQWPFDIQIVDESGNVVFQESRYAYGTGQKTIEDVMTGYGFTKDRDAVIESNERQLADAMLRAAAPELLEAARLAWQEMCHTTSPRNSFTDALDALDAAITKATE